MKPKEVTEHTAITYLKSEELSKVLADGFALLYHNQPQFPVTYLANYLLNHSRTSSHQSRLHNILEEKRKIISGLAQQKTSQQEEQNSKQKKLDELKSNADRFDDYVKQHSVHYNVLGEVCEELERRFKLGGVYIGEVKHPKRTIKDNEDGENAHLETEQPKRIEYIAYSKSQKKIMEGKFLTLESVTGALFGEKAPDAGDGEPDEAADKKKNYAYVPDVVKNERIVFFRLPKLGAYLAVPMICRSYLGESLFETGLEETQKYHKAVEELEKERQKKENEFREQYEQKQRNGAEEKELEDMEKKFEEEKAAMADPPPPALPSSQRQLVVCFDTLGQERQLTENEREQLLRYVEFLRDSWEAKERSYLETDIDNQIKYLQGFEGPIADQLPKFAEEQEKEMTQEMDELAKFKANEKQYTFETDSLRLEKIKEQFQDERYQGYLTTLLGMNVLRFPGIMQAALYFLGYDKKEINVAGTNLLDWRKVRELIIKDKVVDRLCEYTHRGLKDVQVRPYARWNRLLPQLDRFDLNTVLTYNIFYGKLLKYLQFAGRLRKLDCQLRAEQLQQKRRARLERIAENEKIAAEKERVREEQRAQAQAKEDQVFDEEAWETQYNEEHPQQEIGDEIQPEVDLDFDQEEPPAAA